ncbi:fasciclin domain-containing protein [Aegicerativicinus sediminis]|uniref:fasciclin domain-containing protein n=1 Tax=Aegicerativicinus sediminis TaxID=2893202 RepID=UPI001E572235|nr:fasciclin domain-containing protein [Aegicerativicinus sediminis]
MKPILNFLLVVMLVCFGQSCKVDENQTELTTSNSLKESNDPAKTGQAFIKDDESKPTVLSIAIDSKEHSTLVAAVQAANLENALVNAGPLMVFAPTNDAFEALPEGTVENLLKPENKEVLANILKYHVTPGKYSEEFLTKFKQLGQANNQYVNVEVVDGKPVIGGAHILASIEAGNGIVHVIDKVLLPPTE